MHYFNTQQVANGYVVTFNDPSRGPCYVPDSQTYVFTDADSMCRALPRILKKREKTEQRTRGIQ